MSRMPVWTGVVGDPERNGLYRLPTASDVPGAIRLDGRRWTGKTAILGDIAHALAFPDYFGANWDALADCLQDLSWLSGSIVLQIDHAGRPEAQAPADWAALIEILGESASYWQGCGRSFAVFLHGGQTDQGLPA